MKSLSRRLLLLELRDRPVFTPEVRLFYDDDITICAVHTRCGVEKLTGQHHVGMLRLTWHALTFAADQAADE